MIKRFIIGQYRPSDSFGHRLDPRGKILFAVLVMIASLFTTAIGFYLILVAGLLVLMRLSDISFGLILQNMKPFLILVSITAVYHVLFSARDTAPLITILGFHLTEGGVYLAASFSLRVLVFIFIAFFLSLTVMPADMAEVLVNWLGPLKKLRVPVNDIALILFIAMRLIPVLAEEMDMIRKAQIVRGVDFSGGVITRARKLVYLLIPVFQSAIRRADDLALAIESRGYISGAERSSYRIFASSATDWLFFSASAAVVMALFILMG
ncbi:MAG: energy-coupling factor transporter transmembrane protein EcfT [Candidatus Zixiibacteriota bacterium]|nr:MAG: energy-coupling factor transporter transmembrane protein EcfT [candidate division Zixibacteria bacterium]